MTIQKILPIVLLLCSMQLNAFWHNVQRAIKPTYALLQSIQPRVGYFTLGVSIMREAAQPEQECTRMTNAIEQELTKLAFMAALDDTHKTAELTRLIALYTHHLDAAQQQPDLAQRLASLNRLLKQIAQAH